MGHKGAGGRKEQDSGGRKTGIETRRKRRRACGASRHPPASRRTRRRVKRMDADGRRTRRIRRRRWTGAGSAAADDSPLLAMSSWPAVQPIWQVRPPVGGGGGPSLDAGAYETRLPRRADGRAAVAARQLRRGRCGAGPLATRPVERDDSGAPDTQHRRRAMQRRRCRPAPEVAPCGSPMGSLIEGLIGGLIGAARSARPPVGGRRLPQSRPQLQPRRGRGHVRGRGQRRGGGIQGCKSTTTGAAGRGAARARRRRVRQRRAEGSGGERGRQRVRRC